MKYSLGEINIDVSKSDSEKFKEFKLELEKYYEIHKEIPPASKFQSMRRSCDSGRLARFNISCWNDIIKLQFGRVKRRPNNYWTGQKGLDRVKKIILDNYKKEEIYPLSKEIKQFFRMTYAKKWIDQGIFRPKDLLKYVYDS